MWPLVSGILRPLKQNESSVLEDLWPRELNIYSQSHWIFCLSTIFLKISVEDDTRYHFSRYSPSIKESILFYTKSFQLSNGKYLFILGDPHLLGGYLYWGDGRDRERERERMLLILCLQTVHPQNVPFVKTTWKSSKGLFNYKKFAHRWALVSSGNVAQS